MRAYGSRRIYDTPPQMKAARARVKKEGEELATEQLGSEADQEEAEALARLEGDLALVYDMEFTCRLCEKRMGDFWYCPTEDACAFCVGVEFPP